MHRKVCSIGNSQGVSIPIDMLEKLDLSIGSEIDIKLDEK
ncbi:MAG: AbrB/MazE/SpoVT family DNA-binding domain-containing protein, partial [Nitrospirota bacterium]